MQIRRWLAPVAALPLIASSLAGAAEPGEEGDTTACREAPGNFLDDAEEPLEICRKEAWFQAADPVGNLAAAGLAGTPTWGDEPPAASWQDGAFAGYVTTSQTRQMFEDDPAGTATFEGSFVGLIENFAVEMHMISPGGHLDLGHALHQEHRFRATLTIDDATLVEADAVSVHPHEVEPAGLLFRFMFVGLLAAMDEHDLALTEDAEHSIRLQIAPWREGLDEAIYTYDSVEAPSGIIFNAEPAETLQYVWVESG
jgi:hypothetical protein